MAQRSAAQRGAMSRARREARFDAQRRAYFVELIFAIDAYFRRR
jgi:hypothetical protein